MTFWFLLKSPWTFCEHAILLLQHNPHSAGLTFLWHAFACIGSSSHLELQNCQWFSGPVFSLTKSVSVIHGGIPTHISRSFGALWGRKTRFHLPCRWQNLGPKASPCDSWSGSGIRILWPKMTKEGPQKRLATFFKTLECVSTYYKNMYIEYIYIYVWYYK